MFSLHVFLGLSIRTVRHIIRHIMESNLSFGLRSEYMWKSFWVNSFLFTVSRLLFSPRLLPVPHTVTWHVGLLHDVFLHRFFTSSADFPRSTELSMCLALLFFLLFHRRQGLDLPLPLFFSCRFWFWCFLVHALDGSCRFYRHEWSWFWAEVRLPSFYLASSGSTMAPPRRRSARCYWCNGFSAFVVWAGPASSFFDAPLASDLPVSPDVLPAALIVLWIGNPWFLHR